MKNTKKKGKFTLFVYPEKPKYFIGVCLEFDLIQEGKTSLEAMENIRRASRNYLKTVTEKGYSDDLLNRPAPDQYWKKYYTFLKKRSVAIKKMKQRKLIPWDKFWNFQSSDIIYDPKFLKKRSLSNV